MHGNAHQTEAAQWTFASISSIVSICTLGNRLSREVCLPPLKLAWIAVAVTVISSSGTWTSTENEVSLLPTGTKAAGLTSDSPGTNASGQPPRSTTIDWPNRTWARWVHQAGKSGFNTAKEQAKAPGTEGFQAFFFAFLTVTGFGDVYENSRTIAETEGHAKPARA